MRDFDISVRFLPPQGGTHLCVFLFPPLSFLFFLILRVDLGICVLFDFEKVNTGGGVIYDARCANTKNAQSSCVVSRETYIVMPRCTRKTKCFSMGGAGWTVTPPPPMGIFARESCDLNG